VLLFAMLTVASATNPVPLGTAETCAPVIVSGREDVVVGGCLGGFGRPRYTARARSAPSAEPPAISVAVRRPGGGVSEGVRAKCDTS